MKNNYWKEKKFKYVNHVTRKYMHTNIYELLFLGASFMGQSYLIILFNLIELEVLNFEFLSKLNYSLFPNILQYI
jgi:hypothetical protein